MDQLVEKNLRIDGIVALVYDKNPFNIDLHEIDVFY